jgi:WD40 repeat protein
LTWSADATLIASISRDNTVKIWDPTTGQCVSTLRGHDESANSVAWSSDTILLASASNDNTIRIWDPTTGVCLSRLEGHSKPVNSAAWSSDAALLASASSDNTAKIWDPVTGECISTLAGHYGPVQYVAWWHSATMVASVTYDGSVKIWEPITGSCLWTSDSEQMLDHCKVDDGSSPSRFHIAFAEDEVHHLKMAPSPKLLQDIMGKFDSRYDHASADRSTSPTPVGYSFSPDRRWITYRGENLLWLPPDYRPKAAVAVSGNTLAIPVSSGGYVIVTFASGNPLLWKGP